jgi:Zn finger protein HypA/HybF involved in hydrogenase expression
VTQSRWSAADQLPRSVLNQSRCAMSIGYDYCCRKCNHGWILFSKRFNIGPSEWGGTKYTCFSCQTFLTVATSLDSGSWTLWCRNHEDVVRRNSVTAQIAETISDLLAKKRGLTPITLDLPTIECPTCSDGMSTVPFGQHLMKCPKCKQYTGECDGDNEISVYDPPAREDRTEPPDAMDSR